MCYTALRGKLLTALFLAVLEGQEKCLRSFIHGYCIESDRLPQQNRALTKEKSKVGNQ